MLEARVAHEDFLIGERSDITPRTGGFRSKIFVFFGGSKIIFNIIILIIIIMFILRGKACSKNMCVCVYVWFYLSTYQKNPLDDVRTFPQAIDSRLSRGQTSISSVVVSWCEIYRWSWGKFRDNVLHFLPSSGVWSPSRKGNNWSC